MIQAGNIPSPFPLFSSHLAALNERFSCFFFTDITYLMEYPMPIVIIFVVLGLVSLSMDNAEASTQSQLNTANNVDNTRRRIRIDLAYRAYETTNSSSEFVYDKNDVTGRNLRSVLESRYSLFRKSMIIDGIPTFVVGFDTLARRISTLSLRTQIRISLSTLMADPIRLNLKETYDKAQLLNIDITSGGVRRALNNRDIPTGIRYRGYYNVYPDKGQFLSRSSSPFT